MVEGMPRKSTVVIGRTGKNVVTYLGGDSLFPLAENRRFTDVQVTLQNDHECIAGNEKFTAWMWGRGTVAVVPSYEYKRLPYDFPMIKAHNGAVTALQWSPFSDRLLATASEDGLVRCFVIDEAGISSNIMEADVELEEHNRKIVWMEWHNSVDNVIASSAVDKLVKVWDVNKADTIVSLDLEGTIQQMQWGPNGDVLACTNKDTGELILVDPRDESSKLNVTSGLSKRF